MSNQAVLTNLRALAETNAIVGTALRAASLHVEFGREAEASYVIEKALKSARAVKDAESVAALALALEALEK